MASWQHVFLFPLRNEQLQPSSAVDVLTRQGLKIDGTARRCVPTDSEGHLIDSGEEIQLSPPVLADIKRRLDIGEQFSIECRNSELMVVIVFAHRSPNPHVFMAWPRKFLNNLNDINKSAYWKLIRDFAESTKAGYVIVVDDASDHFEDRFVEVDGLRYLDLTTTHQYGHGVRTVWVKRNAPVPEGVTKIAPNQPNESWVEYIV